MSRAIEFYKEAIRNSVKPVIGRDMLPYIMEDKDGMYKVVFFPDDCRKNHKTIMGHSILIIGGRLLLKDGAISIIGKNATSLAGLKKPQMKIKEQHEK